ncbi:MAG: transcriptional regulator [Candidatus Rokubacteria bacterium 13_1_40CM_4_69_5]|nr:MAG: transcriptional regulator [Candidatus Rokubacteria bacterium 13_1_40CM_4_69_5]
MSPTRRDQNRSGKVLVVDDEPAEREGLARLVGQWGYEVETASSGEEALNLIETQHPAVVLTDLVLPEMDGLTLLQKLKETGRPPIVLLVTGHGTVESAVEAMRHGAFDYLTKPVDATRLQVLLEKSIEQESLSREVNFLRHQLRQKGSFGQLVGQSKDMHEVYRWIELAATSTAPVLVYGESGTGKELVARTIHDLSNRRNKPFVAINCAAIPETLIESELFGHERGAFTGATERRLGCFELADGGTLFLDEIAEMDNSTQAKLLRVLQEGSFRRVGGKVEIQVDVRVITATNRVPSEAIAQGQLRDDLFYRLNVFTIRLPALRERKEDIPLLGRTFIEEFNRQDNRQVRGLTPEVEKVLDRHAWPGNVRELRNVIQRAVVLCGTGVIEPEHLPDNVLRTIEPPRPATTGSVVPIREMERELILRALQETNQDKRRAAALLGISLKTLYNKLAKYGIQAVKSARIT